MKFGIVQLSGEIERLQAMASLGGGAAAMDMEVIIFLAMNGLAAFRKEVIESKSWKAAGDVGERMLNSEIPTFIDHLREAKKLGNLKIYACEDTMNILGLTKEDLSDLIDEVTGVAGFFEISADGQVVVL